MASRNQALPVTYTAWDTSNNIGKTGDVANHTLRWVKDGTSAAPTNSATEVDATNAKGEYKLTLTATETDCAFGTLAGVSSTSNVVIIPVRIPFVTSDEAGTGARTVTVTVNDGSTVLENARVRFTLAGATYGIASTNSSGQVVFNLDDATYTVAISKDGYTFTQTTLTVDGTETVTYSMTAQTITTPANASLCTVQFRVKLSNTPVEGAVCKAKILGINQASDGTILSNEESSDTTDSNGVAELALVRKDSIVKGSGIYKIWVTIAGTTVAAVETKIPNQATCLFEDLL